MLILTGIYQDNLCLDIYKDCTIRSNNDGIYCLTISLNCKWVSSFRISIYNTDTGESSITTLKDGIDNMSLIFGIEGYCNEIIFFKITNVLWDLLNHIDAPIQLNTLNDDIETIIEETQRGSITRDKDLSTSSYDVYRTADNRIIVVNIILSIMKPLDDNLIFWRVSLPSTDFWAVEGKFDTILKFYELISTIDFIDRDTTVYFISVDNDIYKFDINVDVLGYIAKLKLLGKWQIEG